MTIKSAGSIAMLVTAHVMTKREMMAMHIAAGLISNPQVKTHQVAEDAVRVADLLLAELERTNGN